VAKREEAVKWMQVFWMYSIMFSVLADERLECLSFEATVRLR